MSVFSLIIVLQNKTSKIINGKANISKKSQKITPFGGNFKWETFFPSWVPEKRACKVLTLQAQFCLASTVYGSMLDRCL